MCLLRGRDSILDYFTKGKKKGLGDLLMVYGFQAMLNEQCKSRPGKRLDA
jgi:hypothetical protein